MARKKFANQQGFTIIEVMVVLVIAAIIIMIVFFAVPALQRNTRNTRRKRDAAQLATLIRECMVNNQSDIYRCKNATEISFNASIFSIYTGVHYGSSVFPSGTNTSVPPTIEEPNWLFGLKCTPSLTWFSEDNARPRDFVVGYFLEDPRADNGYAGRCIDG